MKKFYWVTDDIRTTLSRGYIGNEITVEQRYRQIADHFETVTKRKGISDKIYDYCSRNLISFSSPILSNFGTNKGLPISCNFGVVEDTMNDIAYGEYEMSMLAKNGAGTAKNFTPIRGLGEKYGKDKSGTSPGQVSWIQSYASKIAKMSQGGMRRGFLTAWNSILHADIDSFLNIGMDGDPKEDIGYSIQNITTGVTIPAGVMERMEELKMISPNEWTADDTKLMSAYAKLIKRRSEKGFPYILFEDNCNKGKAQVYKDNNMHIFTSNICTEVIEYCDKDTEFACALLSLNALHYDDWPKDLVWLGMIMLDAVMEEYIKLATNLPGFKKAMNFANKHRAVGLGLLGFHSYLQKNMISWGSIESYQVNHKIFKRMDVESLKASKELAKELGEPEILKGYGERFTSRLAVAPNKSSGEIMGGVSQGIGVIKSNYHEKANAKNQTTYKNPLLVELLTKKDLNHRAIWQSILENNGSVQHITQLTKHEKDVFKTYEEVSQVDIIKLAAQRQKFIDQGQSLNLMISPHATANDIHNLIKLAHEEGIKTLYYQHSTNGAQIFNRSLLECSACDG